MTDKDQRDAASFVLETAHRAVTVERGPQHGPAEQQFKMAGELWEVYLRNKMIREGDVIVRIDAHDVAMMMDLLKTSRVSWGDETQADHYADKAGYTGLAAAIGGVKKPTVEDAIGIDPRPRTPAPPPPAKPVSEPRIVHKHVMPAAPQIVTPEKALEVDAEEAALVALRDKLETPNA